MGILDIFKPTTENPINTHKYLKQEDISEVIIGGTCTHTFFLPLFSYSSRVRECKIIYKQGLNIVLERIPIGDEITENEFGTKITIVLSPFETRLFKKEFVDSFVQIRIIDVDGYVMYNKLNPLNIIKPLDASDEIDDTVQDDNTNSESESNK